MTRTRDNRLKREARSSALWRGHDMSRFHATARGARIYDSRCLDCGMESRVVVWPMPNETEISGRAVSLNCTNPANKES
jgi:hypothetical protein